MNTVLAFAVRSTLAGTIIGAVAAMAIRVTLGLDFASGFVMQTAAVFAIVGLFTGMNWVAGIIVGALSALCIFALVTESGLQVGGIIDWPLIALFVGLMVFSFYCAYLRFRLPNNRLATP